MTRQASLLLVFLTAACATTERRSADSVAPSCDDGRTCHELARSIEARDGVAADRLLARACALGHLESCFDVAVHEADRGNLDAAIARYGSACERGYLPACYNLGTCLVTGPCARDEARGAALLARACDGGEPHACLNLGNSYLLGRGVEKRIDRAVPLLDRACGGGVALACFNLAQVYAAGGDGVAPDHERAADLFARACRDGVSDACARGRWP